MPHYQLRMENGNAHFELMDLLLLSSRSWESSSCSSSFPTQVEWIWHFPEKQVVWFESYWKGSWIPLLALLPLLSGFAEGSEITYWSCPWSTSQKHLCALTSTWSS